VDLPKIQGDQNYRNNQGPVVLSSSIDYSRNLIRNSHQNLVVNQDTGSDED